MQQKMYMPVGILYERHVGHFLKTSGHAFLLVELSRQPHVRVVVDELGQHGAALEHKMHSASWRLDLSAEFAEIALVAFEHALKIQLVDLALKTLGKTGQKRGAAGDENVLEERRANVNVGSLKMWVFLNENRQFCAFLRTVYSSHKRSFLNS